MARHEERFQDIPSFLVVDGRKLVLDQVDGVCRHGVVEVEGGAYDRCLGFKSERVVEGGGNELKELGEGGRIDLFYWQGVLGGGLTIWTRRCHAVGGPLRTVVLHRVSRLEYDGEKVERTVHGLCSSLSTPASHPRPRCICGMEKALVKGLGERPPSWGLRVCDSVECTHIFYESRAGVPTRRREENRRGERVFRGGHWDAYVHERRGNHRGHVVVLYCA